MSVVELKLVVLRVPDLERAVAFYACLGLTFDQHAHGQGPMHYAAELGGLVFELYPQASSESSTKHVRLGFQVPDASRVLPLLEQAGGKLVSALQPSPWGPRAVIDDPFGHRIEVTQTKK